MSSYALVLACPVNSFPQGLEAVDRHATRVLAGVLDDWRLGPGRLMDAYLLLILPNAPTAPDALDSVRKTELSTSVCRRHVLWRRNGSWDDAIDQITVLPLPSAGAIRGSSADPELPERATKVLEMLANGATISAVIQHVRCESDSAAGA